MGGEYDGIKESSVANGKPVRCVETGVVYPSITIASNEFGYSSRTCISKACRDKSKTAAGYHWEFVEQKKFGTTNERQRLRSIYDSMIQRCENTKRSNYKQYGGRGICVCKEWRNNFESFIKWALNNGYKYNLTLDRIDNDDNYEPTNCRWADTKTQANNTSRNVVIEVNGISKTVSQWEEYLDISRYTIYEWIRKHNEEYAIQKISDAMEYGKGYIQCTKCGSHYKGKCVGRTKNNYCPTCRPIALKEYYKEYDKNRNRK